jgi:two-component system phosphate regulon sensor histidine kinase PhoR
MNDTFWDRLRRLAWPATAGVLAGGILFAWQGSNAIWLALGVLVVVSVAVTLISNLVRPAGKHADPAVASANLSTLPPLTREIFERLPDPLLLLNASGRVMFANAAMRGVIGVDPEKKHISSLLRTPSVLDAIRETAETGEPSWVEFTFLVPVQRHYQAYAARIGKDPAVTILLLHDLTGMKRAEQMRADFVANASHELRTPLAAVSGFIATLKGHARDDPEARERFLDIMTVEADRMRRLIDDLLSLTRIEQNEHVPPSGEASLEDILREAVAALAPLARQDRIALEIAAATGLPPATGQRDELIQIFQNLIHNAIKYGKQDGHVWIALEPGSPSGGRGAENMLMVCVRDDGEGIPQASVPRLTERFYRVDVKRSRERGGTGLGLAIVKHIVNRHHGRLAIESRPGEGSTFTVFLPAATGKGATGG